MIEIKGLKKTKPDFLQPLISPCFQAKTFGALASCIRSSVESMQQLDIFKNINVILDNFDEGKGGQTHDVKIVIEGEEKKYRLHAGTELQKNDIGFVQTSRQGLTIQLCRHSMGNCSMWLGELKLSMSLHQSGNTHQLPSTFPSPNLSKLIHGNC